MSVQCFSTGTKYSENIAWASELKSIHMFWQRADAGFWRACFFLQRLMETVLMYHKSSLKMENAFSLALFSPVIIICFTEEKSTAWWCYSIIKIHLKHTCTHTHSASNMHCISYSSFYLPSCFCVCAFMCVPVI